MATRKILHYIGERYNPQLDKSYYVAYGLLFKKEIKAKEECVHGTMTLTGYETHAEYAAKIEQLEKDGFKVNKR